MATRIAAGSPTGTVWRFGEAVRVLPPLARLGWRVGLSSGDPSISSVAILATWTAQPTTSAGRFSSQGPLTMERGPLSSEVQKVYAEARALNPAQHRN